MVSDAPPAGAFQGLGWTCQSSPGSSCGATTGSGPLSHSIARLAPGGVVTYTLVGTVAPSMTLASLSNTARVDVPAGYADLDPANNQDTALVVLLPRADLSLHKSAAPQPALAGAVLTYTLVHTNTGPSYARSITLTDQLSTGVTFGGVLPGSASPTSVTSSPEGQVLVWTWSELADGAVVTTRFTVTVHADVLDGGVIANTATITSRVGDPDSDNNQMSISTAVQVWADLTVVKSVQGLALAGETLTYTISYANLGPALAREVYITDTLPFSVTWGGVVSQDITDRETSLPDWVRWYTPSLAPGVAGQIVFTVIVADDLPVQTRITNTARMSSSVADPNLPNEAVVETDAGVKVDIALRKTVNTTTPFISDLITYTVVVSNESVAAATGVVVNDGLPDSLTFVSAAVTAGTYNSANGDWTIGPLAAGAQVTLTLVASVNGSSAIVNVAQVIETNEPDWDSTPNNNISSEDDQDSVTIYPVNRAPELDASYSPALTAIISTSLPLTNTADTVADIVVDGSITDADGPAVKAIAIVDADGCGIGIWQYSRNGGLTWTAVEPVSTSSALLLGPTDQVRFNPDGSGSRTCTFEFRAWDRSAGVAGTKVDTTSAGESTPYSVTTDTASIAVE